MVSFVIYDLVFLALFILFVVIFLYTRKHNLHRQGILYIYRTQVGVKYIDRFAKRFEKIMRPLEYVIIACGYVLMAAVVWMITWTTYIYIKTPIANFISAPPVFPLIPYFPRLFDLESFFPPLYFTYFIIALAIVAVVHEFAHGIFMRLHKYKIHATGFAFMGPFLGAFVEQDEKEFDREQKKKKKPILAILAAGTFANVLMTILFGAIMFLFFSTLFTPAGVKFNTYAMGQISMVDLEIVGDVNFDGLEYVEILALSQDIDLDGYLDLSPALQNSLKKTYFVNRERLEISQENGAEHLFVFQDSPAFRAQIPLGAAITFVDGQKIDSYETFVNVLSEKSPGDVVNVDLAVLEPGKGTVAEERSYELTLGDNEGRAFLGVGFFPTTREGIIGDFIEGTYNKVKDPILHYESKIGDFGWFVFYLLWWIVVINLLVALFNMLPLGILDGGRFFYLTIWGLTGRESWGKRAYSWATWFLLILFGIMMIKWAMRFF